MEMDRDVVDITTNKQYPNQQVVKDFLIDAQTRGINKRTLETYHSYLKYYMLNTTRPLDQIDKNDLKAFLILLRERELSSSSINSYFAALKSFFEYMEEEGIVRSNPIPSFRARYLKNLMKEIKNDAYNSRRQLISVEDMQKLVNSTLDPRDRAVMVLFAKTGIRRNELITLDLKDIDLGNLSITLKKTSKRTNLVVYFDEECSRLLKRWLQLREEYDVDTKQQALFINQDNQRLNRTAIYQMVKNYAEKIGIHDPKSDNIEDKFTPHCFRHWFTTHLLRNGMSREFVSELRGDSHEATIDIYNHINKNDLKAAYMAFIPKLYI
jgi:integrase/recombinase XerD